MEAPFVADSVTAEKAALLRQVIGKLNTSKALNFWVEVRTFKTLYNSLKRLAREIYLKYLDDRSSSAVPCAEDTRAAIRDKAIGGIDRMIHYDTFDVLKELLGLALERELLAGGGLEKAPDAPAIIFARPEKKKAVKKERDMFAFLSEGDEAESAHRSEAQKLENMEEALAAWYGPDWEAELKRREKERKDKTEAEEKEREKARSARAAPPRAEPEPEAFPGVPLHSEQDSLEKLKKRPSAAIPPPSTAGPASLATNTAFPGIPLYSEHQRPKLESPKAKRKPGEQEGDDPTAKDPPEAAEAEDGVVLAGGTGPKQKERERDPALSSSARHRATRSASPPPQPLVPRRASSARAPVLSPRAVSPDKLDEGSAPSAPMAQDEGELPKKERLASPPKAASPAFPGIPLHLVGEADSAKRAPSSSASSAAPSPNRPKSVPVSPVTAHSFPGIPLHVVAHPDETKK